MGHLPLPINIVIPHPGFRVDRFADGSKDAQAAHIVFIRPTTPSLIKDEAQLGRYRNADPVFFD